MSRSSCPKARDLGLLPRSDLARWTQLPAVTERTGAELPELTRQSPDATRLTAREGPSTWHRQPCGFICTVGDREAQVRTLSSRKRVLTAPSLQEPDRVALDLDGSSSNIEVKGPSWDQGRHSSLPHGPHPQSLRLAATDGEHGFQKNQGPVG
jgi:hypothetical protein